MRVHGDAAHMVMRGGRDGNRLYRRVDAGRQAARMDRREFLGKARAQCLARIEECAAAVGNLREHAAGDDVARGELGERMARLHEALAAVVDQCRAFAAQRFGRKRSWVAADHDRGRVELHEFGIGDHGACARGDRKPQSAGFKRIGRHRVEVTDAAGCEHHRARRDGQRPRRDVVGFAQLQPGDRAVGGQQCFGDETFDHADRRRVAHRFRQRRDDRLAGHVAADMHDAPRRMRGLAADREPAFEVAIEGHAVMQEIVDARGRLACKRQRNAFVDNAAADRNRIGGVRLGAVAFGDCRRDAALRPGAGGALAERRGGNQGDRPRRELQRAEQSGKSAADDDDIVGPAGEIMDIV